MLFFFSSYSVPHKPASRVFVSWHCRSSHPLHFALQRKSPKNVNGFGLSANRIGEERTVQSHPNETNYLLVFEVDLRSNWHFLPFFSEKCKANAYWLQFSLWVYHTFPGALLCRTLLPQTLWNKLEGRPS